MSPVQEEFPYSIRVESMITESNGSSSMASVCGGCLSMQDAGELYSCGHSWSANAACASRYSSRSWLVPQKFITTNIEHTPCVPEAIYCIMTAYSYAADSWMGLFHEKMQHQEKASNYAVKSAYMLSHCRRTYQKAGRRSGHGLDPERGWVVQDPHRHSRQRGCSWRHGFQGGRRRRRHHCLPNGHQSGSPHSLPSSM